MVELMNHILWSALRGAMKSMTALLPLLKKSTSPLEVTLGLFHLDRKEYRETKLYGIKEIISLTGTLDMSQKKPYGYFNIALGGEGAIHGQPYGLGRHWNYRQNHRHLF